MESALFTLEDKGPVAVIRFKPREGLFTADSQAMIDSWQVLDRADIRSRRVLLFRMPRNYFSPQVVDDFRQRVRDADRQSMPSGKPHILSTANVSVMRILTFL